MVGNNDPFWATKSNKMKNTKIAVKRGIWEGRRYGTAAPFSFGEGDAYGKDTASEGTSGPLATLNNINIIIYRSHQAAAEVSFQS